MEDEQQADNIEVYDWLEEMRCPLFKYCLHMTGSQWEAEDLVQDTLVRLFKAGAKQQFAISYARRTARNLWIDRWRRNKRVKITVHSKLPEQVTVFSALDVREHLEELAWRLSPKPFVILLLMEVFHFTAKETADLLGGTEVSVQVALSRARSRLQSLSHKVHIGESHGHKEASTENGSAVPAVFFEKVLEAFRNRQPAAIQEAYLSLSASGVQLQQIRPSAGKLYFTFQDPDGNVLMVSS